MQNKIMEFQAGQRIEGFYLIKSYNLKTSSNNKKYLDMMLADATGEVNAKLWDVDEELEQAYGQGDIIKIRGDVTLWNDQLQLKIIKSRPLQEDDDIDYNELIPSAPLKAEHMYDELMQSIQAMQDHDLQRLCHHVFETNRDKLLYYPAAMRNHHAIRSGLLYHLLRMVKSGEKLAKIYDLKWDLLLAGILLHDLDKLHEMQSNELGIVGSYSREGILLGHIVTGITRIHQLCEELNIPEEKCLLLEHMVLSHHYEPEYGSPKKPMFPEAELLHHLDMIDARMYDMKKAQAETSPGQFSEPIFSLDRRRVYRPQDE